MYFLKEILICYLNAFHSNSQKKWNHCEKKSLDVQEILMLLDQLSSVWRYWCWDLIWNRHNKIYVCVRKGINEYIYMFCLLLKICIVNYDECEYSLNLFAWETATMYFFFTKPSQSSCPIFGKWIMHMGMVWKCMAWEFSNNKDTCKPFWCSCGCFSFIFLILLCVWPPFHRLVKIWRGRKSLGEAIAQREAKPPDGQMAGLFRKFPGRRRKHATLHQEA